MLKENYLANQKIKPNSKELEKLKSNFPQFFIKDGSFVLDCFTQMLKTYDIKLEK